MSNFEEKQDGYLNMELLRFTTAGSVDDGKSTLIGRLLFDSKAIFEDQMEAIQLASLNKGEENVNLALLTDGLRAEREQGITIDVAYRYFATPKRKFIIADTPGHIQYTRNMVTGASTANAALILIDARNGVVEQTLRHSFIASLLQIPHVIICINKMDLVDYKEEVFEKIRKDYEKMSSKLNVKDVRFVPISALVGDNVVDRSKNMDWYNGPTLMYLLEHIHISNDRDFDYPRLPVQYVIRPQSKEYHDFRGYAGRVAGGVFKPGDKVEVLPSGLSTKVKSIEMMNQNMEAAHPPQSILMTLEDEIDISRGDMIVGEGEKPKVSQELKIKFCWMNQKNLVPNGKYLLQHTTRIVKAVVKSVDYKININTLEEYSDGSSVELNEVGQMTLKTAKPLMIDPYENNRITGSVILIDEGTNETVCAGMIV